MRFSLELLPTISLLTWFTSWTKDISDTGTNSPVTVNVQVSAPGKVIFSGPVKTTGHNVTTASGGIRRCDGTGAGKRPYPFPTCTSALDDALNKSGKFTFNGPFYNSLDDFLIDRIECIWNRPAPLNGTGWAWFIYHNDKKIKVGGCHEGVSDRDYITFRYEEYHAW